MTFLNPLLLIAAAGIGLPILAHLLNRHRVKRTDWAAMQFLSRSVRVRSRQLRLRDLLLLCLRCLAVLLIAFALAKPVLQDARGVAASAGEPRAGVIIALDASFSMQHKDNNDTRFERAVKKAELIAESVHPGDPITLVLLGAEHRVVVGNMAFDAERFDAILQAQTPSPEPLDLDSVPRVLGALIDGIDAPQKEVYVISDMQAHDWDRGARRLQEAFTGLGESAGVTVVPVQGDADNLAITDLELVSGVLRKGTVARYSATVRNFGPAPVTGVVVKGLVNNINVDTKTIPSIAAGASETVSLFVPFHDPGPARIAAELETDGLLVDNARRTVAVIRDQVAVLCVEGSASNSENAGGFIAAALRARGHSAGEEDFAVQTVPWVALPGQDLSRFDVVILANVPSITPDQARDFEDYVRAGNGLIWFPGDEMKSAAWNTRSAGKGAPLLPASIEQTVSTGDALGVGRPLEPVISDHPVARPLLSLSEDLLSEAKFHKVLQVDPAAGSTAVLSLAGDDAPLLVEHAIGRGQVFMFTSSAEPLWNNMALTPVFPMLLQQMVTYLTAREFEQPRMVGRSLSLSYVDQPDASDAVFDTPSGETIAVPVREHRNQYVALLDRAHESGFYLARVSVQAQGMPVAVNVDTRESDVRCLPVSEIDRRWNNSDILVARSDEELLGAIESHRSAVSYWRAFLIAGLVLLLIESLLADRMLKKPSPGNAPAPASAGGAG